MSLIRKHVAVLQACACLALVLFYSIARVRAAPAASVCLTYSRTLPIPLWDAIWHGQSCILTPTQPLTQRDGK